LLADECSRIHSRRSTPDTFPPPKLSASQQNLPIHLTRSASLRPWRPCDHPGFPEDQASGTDSLPLPRLRIGVVVSHGRDGE
ncbi:hypothetical protein CLOP_g12163, partial [Closterium sp. NIES-67]